MQNPVTLKMINKAGLWHNFWSQFFSSKDDVGKIQLQYSDLQKTWNHTTDWKLLEGNNGFWVKRETELGLSLDFNLESHAQMYLICLSQSKKKRCAARHK